MTIDLGVLLAAVGAVVAVGGILLKLGRDRENFGNMVGQVHGRLDNLEKQIANQAEIMVVLSELRETVVYLKTRMNGLEKHWQEVLDLVKDKPAS